jgi:hypothetical protein
MWLVTSASSCFHGGLPQAAGVVGLTPPLTTIFTTKKPNGNYGLFLRFWDERMGTTHSNYDEVLRSVQEAASRPSLSGFKPKRGCGA